MLRRQSHAPPPDAAPLQHQPSAELALFRRVQSERATRRSQTLSAERLHRFARLPPSREAFTLAPYGAAWHADVLVVYTNALRRETRALFLVVYALHERLPVLETGDIESFFIWYRAYHDFVTAVVELLQDTFLPWVQRAGDLPASTPSDFFHEMSTKILRTVRKTLQYKDLFLGHAPAKAAHKFHDIFSAFVPGLLRYCRCLEECSSMMIECHSTEQETMEMSRVMAARLKEKPNFRKNIVLLLRWLKSRPESCLTWRKHHLDKMSNIAYIRWKRPGPPEECMLYLRKMAKLETEDNF